MSQIRPISIAFYNGKGGVGKTTLSVLTASLLHKMGLEVLFIDTDPQISAHNWSLGFPEAGLKGLPFPVHVPVEIKSRAYFLEFVRQRRTDTTSVVIFDLPPVVDHQMNHYVLHMTDLVIMPVIPDQLTLDAITSSLDLIRAVQEERRRVDEEDLGPAYKIVINKFKKVLTVHKSIANALRASDELSVYDTYLGDLSGFTNASSARTSLEEATAGANTVPLFQLRNFVDEVLDDAKALGWDLRAKTETVKQ